jgi:hypothetical protein
MIRIEPEYAHIVGLLHVIEQGGVEWGWPLAERYQAVSDHVETWLREQIGSADRFPRDQVERVDQLGPSKRRYCEGDPSWLQVRKDEIPQLVAHRAFVSLQHNQIRKLHRHRVAHRSDREHAAADQALSGRRAGLCRPHARAQQ